MSCMTTAKPLPIAAIVAAAAMFLAACGGSGGDDPAAGQSDDAKQQAFAHCMRKAGLKIETSNDGHRVSLQVPKGVSPARLQKVQRDCARSTGGGPREPSKAEKARFLDQALKFARCMRAHGVDIPDPQADGKGIRIGGPPGSKSGGETLDPKAPAFQRAQTACGSFLPGGKGKGGALGFNRQRGGDAGPSVTSDGQ
jgi:hypothetical protein